MYGSPTNGHIPTRTGDPHDVNVVLCILEKLAGYELQRFIKTLAGTLRETMHLQKHGLGYDGSQFADL
jgi:hypothetical protein